MRWTASAGALAVLLVGCVAGPPPPEPRAVLQNLTARAQSEIAVISWAGAPGQEYLLQLDADADFVDTLATITTTDTIVTLEDVSPQRVYHVRVTATAGDETTPEIAEISFGTPAEPLPVAAPTVTLTAATATSLEAAWTTSAATGTRYQVEWSRSADLAEPRTTTVDSPDRLLEDLDPETTYYLRVRAVGSDDAPLSEWSETAEAATPAIQPLVVASFNVGCYRCSNSRLPSWEKRRAAVADRINSEAPDVIGIQELAHSRLKGSRVRQVDDLMNRLDERYASTTCGTRNAPVCARARNETHVFYNTETVEAVEAGVVKLPNQKGSGVDRWMTWAVLRQKNTGKEFLFATVHLRVGAKWTSLRLRQARAAAAALGRHGLGELPTFMVGDFNSNRHAKGGNPPYRAMTAVGLVDPLGRGAGGKNVVEKEIHTRYNSFNRYSRRPPRSGTNVDYIFTTPMRVSEYEVVLRLNSAGRVTGPIPSDHNMLKATVWLP